MYSLPPIQQLPLRSMLDGWLVGGEEVKGHRERWVLVSGWVTCKTGNQVEISELLLPVGEEMGYVIIQPLQMCWVLHHFCTNPVSVRFGHMALSYWTLPVSCLYVRLPEWVTHKRGNKVYSKSSSKSPKNIMLPRVRQVMEFGLPPSPCWRLTSMHINTHGRHC